ncbi:MAG: hypothetical protein JRI68_08795 [Deltaproteobacteria bacterium]|nr:hypothetical protein [Deltaproteobacteria bacterium]
MESVHIGLVSAVGTLALVGLGWSAGCSSDDDTEGGGGSSSTTSSSTTTTTPSSSGTGGGGGEPICEPADVSGYTHDWKPSGGLYQEVCTATLIDDLFTACLESGSDQTECDNFSNANPDCVACAVSTPDMEIQAPIVIWEQYGMSDANMGPCVSAFEDDDSASSCGATIDAAIQCQREACLENCAPYEGNADLLELETCVDDAAAGDCQPFVGAAETCSSTLLGNGDPIDACEWDEQNETWFVYARRLVAVHCGADPGTGGAGGTGGSGGAGGS